MKLNMLSRERMIDDIIKASKKVNQQVNQMRYYENSEKAKENPDSLEIMGLSQLTRQLKHYYKDQEKGEKGGNKMKGMLYKDKFGDVKISTNKKDLESLESEDLGNLYDRILGNKMKYEDNGWIGLANYKTSTRMGMERAEKKSYSSWVKSKSEKAQKEYEAAKELHEQQPNLYPKAPTIIKPAKVSREQMKTFWRLYNKHRDNLKDKDFKEKYYTTFDNFVNTNPFGDEIFNLNEIQLEAVLAKAEMFQLIPEEPIEEIVKWYNEVYLV